MMTRLKNDINEFYCIVQVADIHIRLQKRHDEYIKVFDTIYGFIDNSPKETVITVVGDLLHSKVDLSPECIQLAGDFLKRLADTRPTILVPGNHDALLMNKDRLDSLSPVVNALNHPNLYYLKKSGLYILGDILFNNMSVFESYETYIKAKDIPTVYRHQTRHLISLYHGTIDRADTDVGHVVNNKSITVNTFDGHDIALCGDIHKMQTLYIPGQDVPIIHYVGSTMQQDHGESIDGHGCTIWNLKTKQFKHINIPNDYGFFTVQITKGKLVTDTTGMPTKVRLRVMCLESVATEVKAVVSEIKKTTEIIECVYIRLSNEDQLKDSLSQATSLNLNDISSVDYQNTLIKDFITKKFSDDTITQDQFDKIFEINKEFNGKLENDNLVRNIRWKPKKLEFSNMFSYGEDNVIDFTNLHGVVGLFAPNSAGKSSTLDVLSFCLYDKCSKAFKASLILNSQKMSFKCKFNFEISGVDYFVERSGSADKKGNVKVDVKFYKIENGKTIELNGEARRSTNDIIRDFVGSYDDFILTVLSVQNNKSGTFIDMGQTERKDLLSQFMGLNVFDMLYMASSEKLKEINVLLRNYNSTTDKTQDEIIEEYNTKIKLLTDKFKTKTEEIDGLQTNRTKLNTEIISLNKELLAFETDVPKNVEVLETEKAKLEQEVANINASINLNKSINAQHDVDLGELNANIKALTDKNVVKLYEDYISLSEQLEEEKIVLDKKKIIVQSKLDKIEKLKNHKYDPNCKFCIDNAFVKDAEKARISLLEDKTDVDALLLTNKETIQKIEDLKYIEKLYTEYIDSEKKKVSLEKEISSKTSNILKLENQISKCNVKLKEITDKIDIYYDQKEAIEHNNNIEQEMSKLNVQMVELERSIKLGNSELMKINTDLTNAHSEKGKLVSELDMIKKLEIDQKAYNYYVTAVSRDGIPFELISQAIPLIEKEVNEILHQVVEFGVNVQTDGKNVMTYIVKDNKRWPLELAGGMEKFLTGLALRVALINISNLPKCNFIAIDEGWATMDAENISSVSALFSILKEHFEFIWIISHLDSMRDFVNIRLEIVKENGFSKINYM